MRIITLMRSRSAKVVKNLFLLLRVHLQNTNNWIDPPKLNGKL
ncbi:hypothetical protein [Brunnivagina elsteri]|nr:hypothetical protein [Calothrix elsteri]